MNAAEASHVSHSLELRLSIVASRAWGRIKSEPDKATLLSPAPSYPYGNDYLHGGTQHDGYTEQHRTVHFGPEVLERWNGVQCSRIYFWMNDLSGTVMPNAVVIGPGRLGTGWRRYCNWPLMIKGSDPNNTRWRGGDAWFRVPDIAFPSVTTIPTLCVRRFTGNKYTQLFLLLS